MVGGTCACRSFLVSAPMSAMAVVVVTLLIPDNSTIMTVLLAIHLMQDIACVRFPFIIGSEYFPRLPQNTFHSRQQMMSLMPFDAKVGGKLPDALAVDRVSVVVPAVVASRPLNP